MRKLWLVGAIVLVVLLAAVWIRWRKKLVETSSGSPPPVTAAVTRRHIDPPPAISLQINRANELMLYRGTPMVISVSIVNHRAMMADAQQTSDRVYIQQLHAAADRGELPKKRVEGQIARMGLAPEVSSIHLGEDTAPWDSFLHLSERLPGGTERPLAWATKVVQPPAAKRVTLDAQTSADLTFAIEPSVASQIASGEYEVVAALDVPANGTVKSGNWTGQARSEPVKLIIQDKPLRLTPGDAEKIELQFANYFYVVANFPEAARHAEAALATNPKSISADIVLGETKRAQGDLKGALGVFQKATVEFYLQNPNSYEPPTLLLSRISDLQEKLESAEPKAASPR